MEAVLETNIPTDVQAPGTWVLLHPRSKSRRLRQSDTTARWHFFPKFDDIAACRQRWTKRARWEESSPKTPDGGATGSKPCVHCLSFFNRKTEEMRHGH